MHGPLYVADLPERPLCKRRQKADAWRMAEG